MTFAVGSVIDRREVLHGHVWMDAPVRAVSDDGEHLAVRIDPGAPLAFPAHPFGPHPWSHHKAWGGSIVLQVYRPDDLYSVWKIFETNGDFRHWYVNFEAPLRRDENAIETLDYGIDLILDADGRREWKDVTDLHHQRAEGRINSDTVLDVLAAAAQLEEELDAGKVWWTRWNDWTPETKSQPSRSWS